MAFRGMKIKMDDWFKQMMKEMAEEIKKNKFLFKVSVVLVLIAWKSLENWIHYNFFYFQ